MKRILVVSWFFPPVNSSEGLVTYKLLNNSKYKYDVFTQNSNNSWSYGNDDYLKINSNIKCIFTDASDLNGFKQSAIDFFKQHQNDYDIVMTRSMPEEDHMVGLEIKKINPMVKWIASFGDPIGNNPYTLKSLKCDNSYSLSRRYEVKLSLKFIFSPKRFLKNCIYKRNFKKNYNMFIKSKNDLEYNILSNADYVICNNQYQKEYILNNNHIKDLADKIWLLPHTFDLSLYPLKKAKKEDKIIFSYVGHLDDIRTPRLILESIKELYLFDKDLKDKVEFDFYGNMSDSDKLFIINNDLFDIVKIKKPVKYLESLSIMKNSDWLIHIDANIFDIIDNNIFFAAKLADYLGSKQKIFGLTMLDGISADILRENNALVVTYSVSDITNYLRKIIFDGFSIKMNDKTRNNYDAVNVASKFDEYISLILCEVNNK